jgi:hypothetical protein
MKAHSTAAMPGTADVLEQPPNPQQPTALTPEQDAVYRALFEIGSGPPEYFRDACLLAASTSWTLASTTHLVAHLLREVNGALLDVFSSPERIAGSPDLHPGELTKFRSALEFLEIDERDALAIQWRQYVKSDEDALFRRAHRDGLSRPRPVNDTFLEWFQKLVSLFHALLGRYRQRFLKTIDYIDSALLQEDPPRDFRNKIPATLLAYRHLFGKLNNPRWLAPLKQKGFFANPPAIIPDASGVLRGAVPWPQTEYLKRLAKDESGGVREQVLDIMLEVGRINNYFVHRDLTLAALSMPADMAAQWAEVEGKWLRAGNQMGGMLEDVVGSLISKLAKEGQPQAALELARELLDVQPDPEADRKRQPKDAAEQILYASLLPSTRCEEYRYREITQKRIPDLAAALPFETLDMLCVLLENTLEYVARKGEAAKPYDISIHSRPAIEDHGQNQHRDVANALISAVRDVAEGICRAFPGKVADVVTRVESHGWTVFRRIGMHLLRVTPTPPLPLIEERLLDRELFEFAGVHHEYFHLINTHFGRASQKAQEMILGWIAEGGDLQKQFDERPAEFTPADQARRLAYWRFHKLRPIQAYLSGQWKEQFDALKAEFTDSEIPPDFEAWTDGGWFGSQSPKTNDELRAMSMAELVQFLRSWKPSGGWGAPTPVGLGGILQSLVAEHPERYTAEIDLFMDPKMDPTYVRHLISGFCQAVEAKKRPTYSLLLKLCHWVVAQPIGSDHRTLPGDLREGLEVDRTWDTTRLEIARLFDRLFNDEFGFPYDLRAPAWALISALTQDPSPSLAYEAKYGGDNQDALTISLNTVRGRALHAMMHYAMWVCRRIQDASKDGQKLRPKLADIPEVRDVLDSHLVAGKSPFASNQTDRAVYGHWLPQLVYLDREWVVANLRHLFPQAPEAKDLYCAAWHSYLKYSQLYPATYDAVRPLYFEAVSRLAASHAQEDDDRSPDHKLTEHVIMLYARERVSLNPDDLLTLLFSVAPVDLTAHAMEVIGKIMQDTPPPAASLKDRFKALWEWRVQTAGGMEKIPDKELSAFGWWFASGGFGAEWDFSCLEKILQRTSLGLSQQFACDRMATLFKDYPAQSLRCLRLLLDRNDDHWFFYPDRERGVWRILEQGMSHPDPSIKASAEEIIHLLGSRGFLEYRELRNPSVSWSARSQALNSE